MNRKDALACIRAAGYEGDQKTALRIYVENRVSFQAFQEAYRAGVRMRQKEQEAES